MSRKPRKPRPNERYEGYDSKFEYDLHQDVLKEWDRDQSYSVAYAIPKKYLPDFIRVLEGRVLYIEAKGRFWDSDEYAKYRWVRDYLGPDKEIIFIFYNPNYPMPRSKVRKDGTKMTHGEWASNNGFRWYTAETFPEELR